MEVSERSFWKPGFSLTWVIGFLFFLRFSTNSNIVHAKDSPAHQIFGKEKLLRGFSPQPPSNVYFKPPIEFFGESERAFRNANSKSNSTNGRIPYDLLIIPGIPDGKREAADSEILADRKLLEKFRDDPLCEEVLFRLANRTAVLGKYLEACKLYDQFLKRFPSSSKAERAYYRAIRLRAVLKAFSAVVSWGENYLETFPVSPYCRDVSRLVAYAQAEAGKKLKPGSNIASKQNILLREPQYVDGMRRINSVEYF